MLPIQLLTALACCSFKLAAAEDKYQLLELTRIDNLYYGVNVTVGSDEQKFNYVLIDTGSSDFWVLDKSICDTPTSKEEESSNEESNEESCKVYGAFDSEESNTFHATGQKFDASYGDNNIDSTGVLGIWGIDQMRVGDIHLNELYFGLATNESSVPPILGIGQLDEEASSNSYPNFPYQLKEEGYIDIVAYSLSLGQTKGELLFGAIDHSKYNGTLLKTPMVQAGTTGMQVLLNGVSLTNGSSTVFNETDIGYIYFDSGTSVSTLPAKHFDDIFKLHGWEYVKDDLAFLIECGSEGEKAISDLTLEYTISGDIVIKVPFEDMILQDEIDGKCISSVSVSDQISFWYSKDNSNFVAGDDVLLNAYVVYNLETQELAIAPAVDNPEDTEADIELISEDFDIPEARDYSSELEFRSTTLPVTTDFMPSSTSSGSAVQETNSATNATSSSTSEDVAASSVRPVTLWSIVVFFCQFLI